MKDEIWKPIKGYEGLYEVSNLGNVKSLDRIRVYYNAKLKGKLLKQNETKKGYLCVRLYNNGISKSFPVHRLVALTFIENIENKDQVDHIDGNCKNNTVNNLRWATAKENCNNPNTVYKRKGRSSHMRGKKGKDTPMWGIRGSLNKKSKPVVAVSVEDGSVHYYENAVIAANAINGSFGNIRNCCRGNNKYKTHKGYKWYDLQEFQKN